MRASTSVGTRASMAAMVTVSALLRLSRALVINREIVLTEGTFCSCCLVGFSAHRRRVVHSLTTRKEPRKPCPCKRRQSSAPLRQPSVHFASRKGKWASRRPQRRAQQSPLSRRLAEGTPNRRCILLVSNRTT